MQLQTLYRTGGALSRLFRVDIAFHVPYNKGERRRAAAPSKEGIDLKFSDGFWLNKPGYDIHYAVEPYELYVQDGKISVVATKAVIENRGQTLEGPVLDITFASIRENTIQVTIEHFKGQRKRAPEYKLCAEDGFRPVTVETDEYAELVSGKTRVRVYKGKAWRVEYYYGEKLLTKQGWRTTSYITEAPYLTSARMEAQRNFNRFFADDQDERPAYVREMLNLSVGEDIYGFGEKFTPFVKNGQRVEMWNGDGGTCSEYAYKSIPFYVSNRGYGVFVNHSEKVDFEVATETVSKVSFVVPGERMQYFVIGGENIADVISNYTSLTGKPALPPAYSFGLWLTTSFTTNYDEKTVSSFVDGMAERSIPLQVFHFDCFWMQEFRWCDFTFDKRMFPDPKGFIQRLKARGLQICVWINPYIGQHSALFDEGMENGYLLKRKNGDIFQTDMWQPGMAIVDFTNPAARRWYADKLRALCDMGVDAFKTDFGERIPTDVQWFDGSDPLKMHNYYTQIYNGVVFDVLKEYYGEGKACLFARSATAGGQQYPVHWGGDCFSQYESMAETLRGGLSLCLSGFGFFSHDISGFEATSSPDLYKRWVAFGLMSTHSRLHGNSSYRVPWLFDEESCDVLRHFTCLKGKLMPYLFANAVKTHQTGIPMMRAMVMEYADEPATWNLDCQYMLGDNLLVAPIFNEQGTALYYVPKGRWTDIQTGKVYEGGVFYETKHDYFSLPLLAKPNSIIAYGKFERDFVYDYARDVEFVIYELEDGKQAECTVYDAEGNAVQHIVADRRDDTIEVTADNKDLPFTVTASNGCMVVVK